MIGRAPFSLKASSHVRSSQSISEVASNLNATWFFFLFFFFSLESLAQWMRSRHKTCSSPPTHSPSSPKEEEEGEQGDALSRVLKPERPEWSTSEEQGDALTSPPAPELHATWWLRWGKCGYSDELFVVVDVGGASTLMIYSIRAAKLQCQTLLRWSGSHLWRKVMTSGSPVDFFFIIFFFTFHSLPWCFFPPSCSFQTF